MRKPIKHADLSAEDPGPRAFADMRLDSVERRILIANPASMADVGWLEGQAQELRDEDPGPRGTLTESQRLWSSV